MPNPIGVTLFQEAPNDLILGSIFDNPTGQVIKFEGMPSEAILDSRTGVYIWPHPVSFYDFVPENALAMFSTCHGRKPKRKPTPYTPGPIARTNFFQEAKDKAVKLCREFPNLMQYVVVPREWPTLYTFFDGYDLWVETPRFLYYVLLFMAELNEIMHKEVIQEKEVEIDKWVTEWIGVNEFMVVRLPPNEDLINVISKTPVWEELWDMYPYEFKMLKQALDFHHGILRQKNITNVRNTIDYRRYVSSPMSKSTPQA